MTILKKVTFGLVGVTLSLPNLVWGHEVNSHQAQMMCATTPTSNGCSDRQRAVNLHNFVGKEGLNIASNKYECARYKGYDFALEDNGLIGCPNENGAFTSYMEYAQFGEQVFKDYNILLHSTDYLSMLQAGVVLEDAVWPRDDHDGDGRFNSHFFAPQLKGKKLIQGKWGKNTDAVTWAIDGAVFDVLGPEFVSGANRSNEYSLKSAIEYYRQGVFAETKEERDQAHGSLFVALGHVVHLLQDLHSPAHTRDDGHAQGDVFERFGRWKSGGFNLKKGNLNGENDKDITQAVISSASIKYSSYRDFLIKEAEHVSTSFFSMDTICLNSKTDDFYESDERREDEQTDTFTLDTFLDGKDGFNCYREVETSIGNYQRGYDQPSPRIEGIELWDEKHKNKIGDLPTELKELDAYFKDNDPGDGRFTYSLKSETRSEHLLGKMRNDYVHKGRDTLRFPDDESVLKQNGQDLFARSVGSSEGFLDYFFRGRILAVQLTKSDVADTDVKAGLYIFNNSDRTTVTSSDNVKIEKGATLTLFVDNTESRKRKLLHNIKTSNVLSSCETIPAVVNADFISSTSCDYEFIPQSTITARYLALASEIEDKNTEDTIQGSMPNTIPTNTSATKVIKNNKAAFGPLVTVFIEGLSHVNVNAKGESETILAATTSELQLELGAFSVVGYENNVIPILYGVHVKTGTKKRPGILVNDLAIWEMITSHFERDVQMERAQNGLPSYYSAKLVFCEGDKEISAASCDLKMYFDVLSEDNPTHLKSIERVRGSLRRHSELTDAGLGDLAEYKERESTENYGELTTIRGSSDKAHLGDKKLKLALLISTPLTTGVDNLLIESSTPDELYSMVGLDHYNVAVSRNDANSNYLNKTKAFRARDKLVVLGQNSSTVVTGFLPNPKDIVRREKGGDAPFDYDSVNLGEIKVELYDMSMNKLKNLDTGVSGQFVTVDTTNINAGIHYLRYLNPFVKDIYAAEVESDGNRFKTGINIGTYGFVQPIIKTNKVNISTDLLSGTFEYDVTEKPLVYKTSDKQTIEAKFSLRDNFEFFFQRERTGKLWAKLHDKKMKTKEHHKKHPVYKACGKGFYPGKPEITIISEPSVDRYYLDKAVYIVNGLLHLDLNYKCESFSNNNDKNVNFYIKAEFDKVATLG
ncbi:hypothetical protein PS1M3_03710 [Pseudoalteromonas sp. PS1M3]|uniref:hypothetical protein n=1 Tax=Pseudoalteromonas sp. PS1M3 TaxID=87791 RepID=UPI00194EDFB9|nr:hypothetical protein [Pseudoalteromonas sp. PS1M3]BBW90284.1 hypothetical protein PS1M3_03710 [Pseudoalteromonas sp. PS1M3]